MCDVQTVRQWRLKAGEVGKDRKKHLWETAEEMKEFPVDLGTEKTEMQGR